MTSIEWTRGDDGSRDLPWANPKKEREMEAGMTDREQKAETRMNEPNIYIATWSDPEATVDGPGCSVRDLDAYEARMDAAVNDPELEAG